MNIAITFFSCNVPEFQTRVLSKSTSSLVILHSAKKFASRKWIDWIINSSMPRKCMLRTEVRMSKAFSLALRTIPNSSKTMPLVNRFILEAFEKTRKFSCWYGLLRFL